LSRYSGQTDILVGSPISGRNNPETEELIGCFINTLVLRSDLSASPTFRELLAQVRHTALEAYEHQDLPFEKLVEELQPERDLGRNPVVQVMFQVHNAPRTTRALKDLTVRTIQVERHSAKVDLFLMATEIDGALTLSMEYSTDLFNDTTIERPEFANGRRCRS
jgi:non-ribosomal peptide synthetase component F